MLWFLFILFPFLLLAQTPATPAANDTPSVPAAGGPAQPQPQMDPKRKAALDELKSIIEFGSSTERRNAIAKIKTLKPEEQPLFHEILQLSAGDKDLFVREASIRMIGELKITAAEPVLIGALKDPVDDVKKASVHALSQIETTAVAVQAMQETVKLEDFTTNNIFLLALIRTLGEKKDTTIADFLFEKTKAKDTNLEVRKVCVLYMGKIAHAPAREFLVQLAERDDEDILLRSYAVHSVGFIESPDTLPSVKKLYHKLMDIKSPQERARLSRLRMQLMSTLIRLGDLEVEPELMAAARDDDVNVRLRAIKQLGELKLQSARPLLEFKSKRDESAQVRKASAEALKALDGQKVNPGEDP